MAKDFSCPGSTLCAVLYFGIHSTPVLLQSHVKDPGHSAKSVGRRLQLNAHALYGFESEGNETVNWSTVVWCTETTAVSPGTSDATTKQHLGGY